MRARPFSAGILLLSVCFAIAVMASAAPDKSATSASKVATAGTKSAAGQSSNKKLPAEAKLRPESRQVAPSAARKAGPRTGQLSSKAVENPLTPVSPKKPSGAAKRLSFALDPYQLASFFAQRWDFSRFVIQAAERVQYEMNSAQLKALALSKLLNELSDLIEARQRNLRAGARALYLLERANENAFYMPTGSTMAYAMIVKSGLRRDALDYPRALELYGPVRDSLNREEENRMRLDAGRRKVSDGTEEHDNQLSPWAITVSQTDLVAHDNAQLLNDRSFTVETLKAVLAAERLVRATQERQPVSSFALPSGETNIVYRPLISPDTPIPTEDTAGKPRTPEIARLEPPLPKGQNLMAPADTAVRAAAAGRIAFSGPFRGYGRMVIIDHGNDLFSIYTSMGKLAVYEGQSVRAGQEIGTVGVIEEHNAPGVHFEVRRRERAVKPAELIGGTNPHKLVLGR